MSNRGHPCWRPLGAGFLLALLALFAPGCKSQDEKDREIMGGRLKGNFLRWGKRPRATDMGKAVDLKGDKPEGHFEGQDGPPPDTPYFVDKERTRETTVRKTLLDLGARLADGKVVGEDGRALYFYWVEPRDENPNWKMQEKVEHLEKHYHVIRMYAAKRGPQADPKKR